jgi:hypothetical protein
MLAFQVALGIVMAVAFLGLCFAVFVYRLQIIGTTAATFRFAAAPIWRHRVAIVLMLAAAGALTALGMMKSDARRAVLDRYHNSQAVDHNRPSPFLERYGK